MKRLERPLRMTQLRVIDLRVVQMGVSPGLKARFSLEDSESNVLAFALCHHFSTKSMKILEALYESMEEDLETILTRPGGPGDDVEILSPDDDNPGVSFP